MSVKKYIIIVIGTVICLVNGHREKSSLTFVIDVTTSMRSEIEQVKSTTDKIFDNVFNSKTNNIDDFVLVTFADPSANVTAKTRDRNKFKQALQSIELLDGGTCPEASMAGIILGLKNSHPNSHLYVFTDASAHDYKNVTIAKSLSQKLSTQVNFLLTGICKHARNETNIVYDDIAETTSGHIFNIQKDDVHQIINVVAENLKSKSTVLKRTLVENNFDQQIPFTIDSKISNVFICVSSSDPHFSVYNSKGEQIKVSEVVKTEKNSIVKLDEEISGTYFIKLDQNDRTLVTVTSSSSICFQHGFSTTMPMSINDTSIKPNGDPGEKHILSIQLENEAQDVLLSTAELLDIDESVLVNLTLSLIDDVEQFYITDEFNVPDDMFRIAIIGYTSSDEMIRRVTIPTIQRPKREIEIKEESQSIAPEVNILAEPIIKVYINKTISIKCKVRAVPMPVITWVDAYGQEVQPKIIKYDYPYYGSVLTVEKVDKEGSMTCKAVNEAGKDEKSVILEINRKVEVSTVAPPPAKIYVAVVDDLVLQVPCEGTSQISSNIIWEYRTGGKVTQLSREETDEYKIDNSGTLILKNIKKSYEGIYKCLFESLNPNNWIDYEVQVQENPIPTVYELRPKTTLPLHSSIPLPCIRPDNTDVLNKMRNFIGYARWYKDGYFLKNCSRDVLCDLDLVNATFTDTGVYMCRLSTMEQSISFHFQVIVTFKPFFINEVNTIIEFKENELAFLDCLSSGVPTPKTVWSVGSQITSKNPTYTFNMEIDKIDTYKCIVSNEWGSINRVFEIKSDKECQINVVFHRDMPLFLSTSLTWILGSVRVNKKINIICIDSAISDSKRSFPAILEAKCLENTLFKTNEYGTIDISELKCNKVVDLTITRPNTEYCIDGPSEHIGVGFQLSSGWLGIFDACIDTNINVTAFIKYSMYTNMKNRISEEYAKTQLLSFNSEHNSGCRVINHNNCCFVNKQLLNPEDMMPGLQQIAAYSHLNTAPQWSSCGTENWDEVGRRIRSLSASLNHYLELWIGTSEFTYKNKKINTDMAINDNYYGTQKVPRYIWKLIFNRKDSEGLSIIVTNIPNPDGSDNSCKPPCTDVCDETIWMKSSQWRDASKGCVFCCSLDEFMKLFHYENIFPHTKLLIHDTVV